jgi:hypothetical protein
VRSALETERCGWWWRGRRSRHGERSMPGCRAQEDDEWGRGGKQAGGGGRGGAKPARREDLRCHAPREGHGPSLRDKDGKSSSSSYTCAALSSRSTITAAACLSLPLWASSSPASRAQAAQKAGQHVVRLTARAKAARGRWRSRARTRNTVSRTRGTPCL